MCTHCLHAQGKDLWSSSHFTTAMLGLVLLSLQVREGERREREERAQGEQRASTGRAQRADLARM